MDFDGVIVDTEVIWFEIFTEWFKKNRNYDLTIEEFLVCVGAHSGELFNMLEKEHKIIIDRNKFDEETRQNFIVKSENLLPKEGVFEFIKSIKNENILLALATSSSRKKPITHLKRLNIIQYFDVIVTSEDVEKIKPYPDLFNKAIEKLGVKKEEAIIVEDSANGLLAGNNADIKTIVCTNSVTKHSTFQNYYSKVDSLEKIDLQNILKKFDESSVKYAK